MKSKKILIILIVFYAMNLFSQEEGVFKDNRDGNTYNIVKISNAVWMKENLKYNMAGSQYYNNDSTTNGGYGRFYTFNQAFKACPPGWHLPNKDEWENVINFIPNLSFKKSGFITEKNKSKSKNKLSYYWTSTPVSIDKSISFLYYKSRLIKKAEWKDFKTTIRCVADNPNIEIYDNFVVTTNKYAKKSKTELEKLLNKAVLEEDYDEADIIKNELTNRIIKEEYSDKTNIELNNLKEAAISVNDSKKVDDIQIVLDKRENLSSDLTKFELQILQKEALAKEDYERADKIKVMLRKRNNKIIVGNDSINNINLAKYVGKKYGKTKFYFNMGYRKSTGRLGKTTEEGGWGGKTGFGYNFGFQIPAFRGAFKNKERLNGGIDFALNYSKVIVYYDLNYSAVETVDNTQELVVYTDEQSPYWYTIVPFKHTDQLSALGLNFGGFLNINLANNLYIDFVYKIGISYINLKNDEASLRVNTLGFRKYLSANIKYRKMFINIGYEWGRSFNTTIESDKSYPDEKIPTGMFGISFGFMF